MFSHFAQKKTTPEQAKVVDLNGAIVEDAQSLEPAEADYAQADQELLGKRVVRRRWHDGIQHRRRPV